MLQKININDEDEALCLTCGANILDIRNIRWLKKDVFCRNFREELFECRNCGTAFILHYDLFDKNGHIDPRAFTEDINDLSYNWQDSLSEEQKEAIAEHLKDCPECQDRLNEESLQNAFFASIIHGIKSTTGQGVT